MVRGILKGIEDNCESLKPLTNQRFHPFDLSQEDLDQIKQHFPEFFPRNANSKGRASSKGIEIAELKRLLEHKIQISAEKMHAIIEKFDHKATDRVTWTEFLQFLTIEGNRREVVNDAQLYGLGVKRFIQKDRHRLLRTQEQTENQKVTEYFLEHLVYLRVGKVNLLLAIFENNQARLYDTTQEFKPIQDITFPFSMIQAKEKRQKSKPEITNFKSNSKNIHDYLDQVLDSIEERPVRAQSKTQRIQQQ